MLTHALRGYGPRVFVSYSFADAKVAQQIESELTSKGLQVRREDDTSLFNEKLTAAIPRRMADAEVFIQVLTTTSNRSAWVAKELDWMFEHRNAGSGMVFLPIVFDKASLPERLKEWWFLDLSETGVTPEALEAIHRFCMKSVHVLRLREDDPLSVVEQDLDTALTQLPQDGKRVILDSEGKLIQWAQDTLAFAENSEDQYRDTFLKQETDNFDRLVRRQKIRDEVCRKLMLELMREMKSYTNEPVKDARIPMRYFAQIAMADLVLRADDTAPPPPHPLRTALKDRVAAARAANSAGHSLGFLNPGLYAWVFGENNGAGALSDMEMGAPGFRSIRVQMPTRVFGDMADIYTGGGLTFAPKSELLSGTFINYVMPQIAIHAVYNLVDPATVRDDLEQKYAWRLDQYTVMGMH
jgi:hypothetical protein